ncbi:TPA: hypothetical protein ACJV7Z_000014 [Streptococcus pneumoniae]
MCFVPYYKVNHCEEAFAWYQDVNLVYLVDGVKLPYSQATLEAMYSYLDRHGELFWIEVKEIYTYNHASRRCFKSLGFVENGATEKGMSFILELV